MCFTTHRSTYSEYKWKVFTAKAAMPRCHQLPSHRAALHAAQNAQAQDLLRELCFSHPDVNQAIDVLQKLHLHNSQRHQLIVWSFHGFQYRNIRVNTKKTFNANSI